MTIIQGITKKKILEKLSEVLDPELGISIVDLGLIYEVKIKPKLKITMTLTAVGCPLYSIIEDDIKNKLKELGLQEEEFKIKLTFDPPWTMERMSKKGKKMLGI